MLFKLLGFVALGLSLPRAWSTSVISSSSSSTVFKLGNLTYLTPACTTDTFAPLTSLHTNETVITAATILDTLGQYETLDDVWTWDFIFGRKSALSITYSGAGHAILDSSAHDWMEDNSIALHHLGPRRLSNGTALAPGLYVVTAFGEVSKVYRLYRDEFEAFLFGCIPDESTPSAFKMTDVYIPGNQDYLIPVPSRLYSLFDTRPLAGKRFALKDIYDAKGLQTGGGSRAYEDAYPPATENGPALQKLLDLGAVPVGKSKTSQFAHGADPWEFIDIQYPWNPRGDGYLNAGSSSSGPACAIAGYDWVDFALGSDTRGSVRKPASIVGVYGIRPSWGSLNTTGVIPLAAELDTLGLLARDPQLFYQICNLYFRYADAPTSVNASYTRYPSTLIVPSDYFPVQNTAAQAIYDDFVDFLATEFNITAVSKNISAILRTSDVPEISNFTAFQLNSNKLAEYYSWHHVGKPLAEIWNQTYGRYPAFDPNPRNAFVRAQAMSEEEYTDAVTIKNQFGTFFTENVLAAHEESCSDAIMIYDIGTGGLPSYREEDLNALEGATKLSVTVPNGGLASNYLASTAGFPDLTVPLGQVDYESFISLRTEKLPVSVQLVAYRGCEGMLLDLINDMAAKGYLATIKTGTAAY
ncbi:amidase signature domain-containing protein [Mycena latifolia]|nr:amidase signature domain-containing protein [Mycena latifolia]